MCIRDRPAPDTETPAQALSAARRAIDGALTRDRGRLHGLWSRWQARPADAGVRASFEPVSYTHLDVYKRQFLVFLVVMAVQVTRIRRGAGQALPVD